MSPQNSPLAKSKLQLINQFIQSVIGTNQVAIIIAVTICLIISSHNVKAQTTAAQLPTAKTCFQATTGLTGMIGTIGAITPGSGGTSGIYGGVTLTGGTGNGATANIVVANGSVSSVTILAPGAGYTVGDVLSASVTVSVFSFPVASTSINSSLAGGTVGMYIPGTLTYSQTWQNASETILNQNPIQLDLNGCAVIFGVGTYRQIVYDSLGNQVWDQLTTSPSSSSTFQQADIGATLRTLEAHDQDFVDLLDYLPTGEPSNLNHDNSAGAQAAATAGCSRSSVGMQIYVPTPPNFGNSSATEYYFHDIINNCGNRWLGGGRSGVGGAQSVRGGEIIIPGGTTINYSAATSYFMEWAPTGWPAVASSSYILGGSASNFSTQTSVSDTTSTAFKVFGTYGFKADTLTLYAPNNGFEVFGGFNPTFDDINMVHTYGKNYYLHGDLSGRTSGGTACTSSNGDCSTQLSRFVGKNLQNNDNTGVNTVFTIQDYVNYTSLDHTSGEGANIGLSVFCDAPTSVIPNLDPNLGQCPQGVTLYDVNVNQCQSYCILASDFLGLKIHSGSLTGSGASAQANNISLTSQNYTNSSIPVGRAIIDGGTKVISAQTDCIYVGGTVWDVDINHSEIYKCNISNGSSFGGINFFGTITHVKVNSNTIGELDNAIGNSKFGISISANVKYGDYGDNIFDGLVPNISPIVTATTFTTTNHYHDNVGSNTAAPAISACGTSPSFLGAARDNAMIVVLGGGTPSSCTVTFAVPYPITPMCSVTNGVATNGFMPNVVTSTTGLTFTSTLVSGKNYYIQCSTP